MSSQLGPIEINCDAPSYPIVQACECLDLRNPLDVRWCQLSHFVAERAEQLGVPTLRPWKWFFQKGPGNQVTCSCGEQLPQIDTYTFTFVSERVADYQLGQCPRCGTIFWEEG
jgi:hypothetical protein